MPIWNYTVHTITSPQSILTLSSFLSVFSNSQLNKLECLLDSRWSGGWLYLSNEVGCGLRRSRPYIKACIIIKQCLFFSQIGPKMELTDYVKPNLPLSPSEGRCTLKIANIVRRGHRNIKRYVAKSQQKGYKKNKMMIFFLCFLKMCFWFLWQINPAQ